MTSASLSDPITRTFNAMLDQASVALETDGAGTPYGCAGRAIEMLYGEMCPTVGFRARHHGVDEADLLSEVGEKAVKIVRAMILGRAARPRALSAFAATVVKLTALTIVRRREADLKMRDLVAAEAAMLGGEHVIANPETAFLAKEYYDAVTGLLTDEQRLVLVGRKLGLSDAEIGAILGINANAVQQRRFNLRNRVETVRDHFESENA